MNNNYNTKNKINQHILILNKKASVYSKLLHKFFKNVVIYKIIDLFYLCPSLHKKRNSKNAKKYILYKLYIIIIICNPSLTSEIDKNS